jgi:uncharacterized Zn finger protein
LVRLPNVCPKCGREGHLTLERVMAGKNAFTQYCCRICGYVWRLSS